MIKHTKIISTLGPATSDLVSLKALIKAGVNLVRLNFSHGTAQEHIDRAQLVRQAAKELNTEVGILADLQGPKIRIARFKTSKVVLQLGQTFTLDAELD
ncbi:MAG: pyruvate kinase, partial [Alcanivoracaceae bacterium]|nr:pyruvate kinase [Alcanivoracaceae bacterium]